SFDNWLCYSCGLKSLFEWTSKDEYYLQAHEGFDRAARLNDDSSELWWRWGELLGYVGWMREDVSLLKQAAEKLACADLCESDHPGVLCLWGTVLMHSGALTERLSLLKQAEEKILRSVELDPENADTWCAYGSCLCELACYFGDDEYYLQALSRYQYALTLDPENPRLWQGMGQAQFAAGELQMDAAIMQRSLEAYAKAAELDGGRSPELWADWGVALMKLGDLLQDKDLIEASVQRFEQAIQLHCDGDHREVHWLYHYGCALDILGDFQEGTNCYERAIQVLTHVLSLDPDHRAARHNLALAYFHLGEVVSDVACFQKALAELEQVVSLDEEDEVAWNDWGLTLLSLAQLVDDPPQEELSQQLREQAESKLTQACALGSIQAYYNLACLYSLTGRGEEAIDRLRRAKAHQALPPTEELLHDDWLETAREHPGFQEFLQELN
ncbi:MAG: hypothetical protein KDK78_00620, partial [Chlamydiia bacterium]|nr:hypothetical protein [Chlamydiia bacterium]